MSSDRLRVLFCDHLNLARGKHVRLPTAGPEGGEAEPGDGSARFCRGLFSLTYDKDQVNAPGAMLLDGLPDLVAAFRGADIRAGWERVNPGSRVVVADLQDTEGAPLPMCGRSALKRAVADWRALGLTPMVGLELEAYAFQISADGSLQPYDAPGAYVYGTGPLADPSGFTDAIWAQAEACGFRLDSLHSEFDAAQFEFTLRFDGALQAVDDSFLFRLLAREVAWRHGIVLSFLPKPILARGGSGVHVNVSLQDDAGRNLISVGNRLTALNTLTSGCLAGLLHHHTGMAALVAPCANSYHRLRPGSLAGYWQNWGFDHRGATTRLSAEAGASARLEHRMGDGAANPYTLVATVLQAARLGVVHGYPLPPAETGDGFDSVDAQVGVASNLEGALDALQADAVLAAAVGPALVAHHLAIKRHEAAKTAGLDEAGLRRFYLPYV